MSLVDEAPGGRAPLCSRGWGRQYVRCQRKSRLGETAGVAHSLVWVEISADLDRFVPAESPISPKDVRPRPEAVDSSANRPEARSSDQMLSTRISQVGGQETRQPPQGVPAQFRTVLCRHKIETSVNGCPRPGHQDLQDVARHCGPFTHKLHSPSGDKVLEISVIQRHFCPKNPQRAKQPGSLRGCPISGYSLRADWPTFQNIKRQNCHPFPHLHRWVGAILSKF